MTVYADFLRNECRIVSTVKARKKQDDLLECEITKGTTSRVGLRFKTTRKHFEKQWKLAELGDKAWAPKKARWFPASFRNRKP